MIGQAAQATRTARGLALLRVVTGLIFFMHGWQKFFQMGISGVQGFFAQLGIPAPALAAIGVSTLEAVGGLLLIAGFLTRWIGVLFALDMLVALLMVHLARGFFVADGGYEFVLLLMAASLLFFLAGPGAPSVDERLTRKKRRESSI